MVSKSGYIDVTQDIINTIKSEIDRTQVSAQRMLKGKKEARDIGLTSGIIYSWIGGRSKTAKQSHIDLAIKLWKAIPDADYSITMDKSRQKDELQPIPKDIHSKLKKIQKLTGLLPSRIFKLRDDVPQYLTSNMVGQWLNVKNYRANPKHVHWVILACKETLKEAVDSLD